MISVFALAPAAIAIVSALTSPSCMDPPVDTVCEPVPVADPCPALFEPVALVLLVLLAALLAEFVPLFEALFEPVPFVLLVLLAALLAEFVPLFEALFEPVPFVLLVLL